MIDDTLKEHRLGALMCAGQAGDINAYCQLLEEITPRIRQFVRNRRRFLQPDDIEDITQDILLSIHAVRATYDPQRPFMPWLFAIARNRLADRARRYSQGAAHEVQVDSLEVTFDSRATNHSMDSFGNSQGLKQAIAALPPIQRAAKSY